jgi:hypothetical protein
VGEWLGVRMNGDLEMSDFFDSKNNSKTKNMKQQLRMLHNFPHLSKSIKSGFTGGPEASQWF